MSLLMRCASRTALTSISRRLLCVEVPSGTYSEGEQTIINKLKDTFPKATFINVRDTGGGCGRMYTIQVEAEEFKGKRLVAQHRMINEALKEELKEVHGVTIDTQIPGAS